MGYQPVVDGVNSNGAVKMNSTNSNQWLYATLNEAGASDLPGGATPLVLVLNIPQRGSMSIERRWLSVAQGEGHGWTMIAAARRA